MKNKATLNQQSSGHMARGRAACLAGMLLAMFATVLLVPLAPLTVAGAQEGFEGSSAGDFTLQDMEGDPISLSDFRGKTVLLVFWATWCPPCQKELPTIEKIYQQHQDRDVVVLAVDHENKEKITKFLKDRHYDFTVLIDRKRTLFKKFAVHFVPTVYVINAEGIVVREIVGWEGPQKLLTALKAAER